MFTFAAVLMFVLQGRPQVPPASGSLVGCASDAMQGRIPGVTVVAKTGRVERTTMTDAGGCYVLRDVPVGSYRVTLRAAVFDNVNQDRVTIAAGQMARLDGVMRVSATCECVINLRSLTLAEVWDHSDAVLHVRLAAPESQVATPVAHYRHVATVIDVLKAPAAPLKTPVFVLQYQGNGAAVPYGIGEEAVIFLGPVGPSGFEIAGDSQLGQPIVFLIQDGRIQHAPSSFSRYVGMPLDALRDDLRALPRRR